MAEDLGKIAKNATSLQDIPLSELGATKERSCASVENERKAKTNSLKRFFGLTKTKDQHETEDNNAKRMERSKENKDQDTCQSEEEDMGASSKETGNTLRTRFKLRLGGLQHHTCKKHNHSKYCTKKL